MINKTITTYRDAYTGLSRSTWLLSLVMLINRSGTMVVPFMSLYLTSPAMGYSIGQAGFVFGLFGAGAFSGAWLGGKLTDKIGFYPVQSITLIGGGILFIVLGQMKSYPFICLFTFILSFVNEAFRPANSTAIAFYSKEENRTRSYSLNRLSINLGWAVGSAIGGIIAKYNYELLFWVDGLTNISAAAVMIIFVKPVNYKPTRQKKDAAIPRQSALHDTTYRWFILFTCLFACCFFQLFTNLSVYYKLKLNFSEPYIGFLMATNGLIIVLVEMVIVYKLEGRRKNTFYIITGILLMAAAYFMLNVFVIGQLLAFVMIVVVTFGEILSMPFMNSYWIGRSKTHNRGQYAALYTMGWSAAQTLGPLTGAQIAEHYGFNWLWWIVAGLSLVTAFAFMQLHIRSGKSKEDNGSGETVTGVAELIAVSTEPLL
jgi:predicted MFS family arabinose efflux permease